MRPFVSILTPAYNDAEFLPELLDSAAGQEFANFEHVVIDDGSTDESAAILAARAERDPRLRWWSRGNRGQYATQNELLEAARGEVVTFICADDVYAGPGALARVAAAFREHPEAEVVFGRTRRLVMDPGGRYCFDPDLPPWTARMVMPYLLPVLHCAVFAKAGFLKEKGLNFDAHYRMRGDADWLLRVFRAAREVRPIGDAIACWRMHPEQTSQREQGRGMAETRELCAAHGFSLTGHRGAQWCGNAYAQGVHAASLARQRGAGFVAAKIWGRWEKEGVEEVGGD